MTTPRRRSVGIFDERWMRPPRAMELAQREATAHHKARSRPPARHWGALLPYAAVGMPLDDIVREGFEQFIAQEWGAATRGEE